MTRFLPSSSSCDGRVKLGDEYDDSKMCFDGINFPNSNIFLSHLFYADEALFIGEWLRHNIANLATILRCFYVSSRLKVNFSKSKVFGVGTSPIEVSHCSAPLGCEPSSLPFTYIGIPMGDNMNLKNDWRPIIEKFHSKLSSWKVKLLSFGGRVTLVKVVLGNLTTFLCPSLLFQNESLIPLRKLEGYLFGVVSSIRKILVGLHGKRYSSKKGGGIGPGSTKTLNISLSAKWMWCLKSDYSALWEIVIRCIHVLDGSHWTIFSNRSSHLALVFRRIVKIRYTLQNFNIDPKEIVSRNSIECCWVSDFVIDNRFYVSFLHERIKLSGHVVSDGSFDWCKVIPFKILCFIWRAKLGRIPSTVTLKLRRVTIPPIICGSCNLEEESSDHILLLCPSANVVVTPYSKSFPNVGW